MTFPEFFRRATRSKSFPKGWAPYDYQTRFAESDDLFHLVRAPTSAGKTATAILGWLWRHFHGKKPFPRRLVYCLPMRVLVEQSEGVAREWLKNLDLNVKVHVLMGGVTVEPWHLTPEKPVILVGTQDMLLSRALNRGYAASRFRWPIDFGLLNNDCLWVFDEPQLMGSGVSTSAQLAGLRSALGTFGSCPSVWMSATLEPEWLDTVNFPRKTAGKPLELTDADYTPDRPLSKRMTAEKVLGRLGVATTKDGKDVAAAVVKVHVKGSQTLVVLNTVDRAKAVYTALTKAKSAPKNVLLVHSRFRPHERERLNKQLQEGGEAAVDRIIIATQVVEAGVDISARTLVTELAPWASLVQRMGRCNRTGDDGPGHVHWIDLDPEKQAAPYEAKDLTFAQEQLERLEAKLVSPQALDEFKTKHRIVLRFEHTHVVRKRDVLDLFDTAPDLSGNDIDVQRFVRGDVEESDVKVFWRSDAPSNTWKAPECRRQAVRRVELCNVPIGSFKSDFLGQGKTAFRFDYLDGKWRAVGKKDRESVAPGQVFWVVSKEGGYDADLGWLPTSGPLPESLLISIPKTAPPKRGQRPEGYYDSDEWSEAFWKTIAEHTEDVVGELSLLLDRKHRLPISAGARSVLLIAARWHDWGKAHDVFQSGVADEIYSPLDKELPATERRKHSRPEKWQKCTVVAKAPEEFWRRYRRAVQPNAGAPGERVSVRRFRHELASALGVLALQGNDLLPPDWQSLSSSDRFLGLYLIAAHHGKVRLSIRAMPGESPMPSDPTTQAFAAGVWDGDQLPSVDLGGGVIPPAMNLSLNAMRLGGDGSWSGGVLRLRDDTELGPFRLAYLEALLRAADCRISDEGEDDDK